MEASAGGGFLVARVAGSVAVVLALLAFAGWWTGRLLLATGGSDLIPMAPSTALLFLVFGLCVVFADRLRSTPVGRRGALFVIVAGTALTSALLALALLGIHWQAEHLGFTVVGSRGGARSGHMSPLTALLFCLSGISLALVVAGRGGVAARKAALAIAATCAFLGMLLCVAYLLGGPMLYGSGVIPPALPTSVAFVALGTAVSARAWAELRYGVRGSRWTAWRVPSIMAAGALVVIGITSLLLGEYQHRHEEDIAGNLATIAESKVSQLSFWRNERLRDLGTLSENAELSALVRRFVERRDPDAERRLQSWLRTVLGSHEYRRVALLDTGGHEILATPSRSPPGAPLVPEPPAGFTGTRMLGFTRQGSDDPPYVVLTAPITDEDGRLEAVLAFLVDPEVYVYPMLRRWPIASDTAETMLLRREGDEVVALNDLRFAEHAALRLRVAADAVDRPAALAARGQRGLVKGVDHRGEPVVAVIEPVPDTPWLLVSSMSTHELYGPVRERLWWATLVVAVLLLGSFAIVGWVWQRNEKAYYRSAAEYEARYHGLFDSSRDAIVVADTDRNIVDCNPAFTELFGYSLGDVAGQKTVMLYEDEEEFRALGAALRDNVDSPGFVQTVRFRRKDGTTFPGETNAFYLRGPGGETAGFVGLVRDVTERMASEEELRLSERRHRLMFEHASVGILRTTFAGRVVASNDTMAEMLGFDSGDEITAHYSDVGSMLYADPSRREELLRVLREEGRVQAFVFEAKTRDDRRICLQLDAWLAGEQDRGQPVIEAFVRDITERLEAERQEARLREELLQAQKMESVGRLAGGVAHDFNNMLSVILGNTELALESAGQGTDLREDLEEIHDAAKRSARLTGQLLAFARKQAIAPRVLDLNETVDKMLSMLRRLIDEEITLEWKPCSSALPVLMDPAQLDQILANLVLNARDAIEGVGSITIETDECSVAPDHVDPTSDATGDDHVVLTVTDSGRGMDEAALDRIFDPFFTTKAQGEGTGLGLAMVYGIVRQNEGFIRVESEVGRGTTFRIYMPRCRRARSVRSTPAAHTDGPQGGTETVMVVEDEAPVLQLSVRMLKRLGYSVLSAQRPADALRIVEEHDGPIHLLLSDVVMPEMNGRELAERITSKFPDMRTLFMSGYTADVIEDRGVDGEVIHLLHKPFTQQSLADKVRECLDAD